MDGYQYLEKFFIEDGYRYKDEGNYFAFKVEGVNYIAFKNDDNPNLQITVICNAEGHERGKLLSVCNQMNQNKFVLKYCLNDNGDAVWVNYEFEPNELTTPDDFRKIFYVLDKGSDDFFDCLNKA